MLSAQRPISPALMVNAGQTVATPQFAMIIAKIWNGGQTCYIPRDARLRSSRIGSESDFKGGRPLESGAKSGYTADNAPGMRCHLQHEILFAYSCSDLVTATVNSE